MIINNNFISWIRAQLGGGQRGKGAGLKISDPSLSRNEVTMGPAGSAPPVFFAVPDNSDSPGVTSTPSPDHRYQSPRSNPNVPNAAPNSKVIHPPAFKPQKYNSWRRELLFWKDLYFYINPYQLLATLGAHANSLLKVNLTKYMAQTTDCPAGRSAIGLLGVLYVIYAASSKERELRAFSICSRL